jgi:hypothetical protein
MIEWVGETYENAKNEASVVWTSGGNSTFSRIYPAGADIDKLHLDITGTIYKSTALTPATSGRLVHSIIFADRDGNAYFYGDGAAAGTADISGKSAVDLTSTVLNIGGRQSSSYGVVKKLLFARLHVFSGTFPTAGEMAAIAKERYDSPDIESTTLEARGSYATENRAYIPFNDIDQDQALLTNDGTAGSPTLGGGNNWEDVRAVAEAAPMIYPDEDYYVLDDGYTAANASADLSATSGGYVLEAVVEDLRNTNARPWRIQNAGATERLECIRSGGTIDLEIETNSITNQCRLQAAGYSDYGWERTVIHQLYDATTNLYRVAVNGQVVYTSPGLIADLDLSGNLAIDLGEEVLSLRIWNFTRAGGALPTGWEAELQNRAYNPWINSAFFDGTETKGEWIMGASSQVASSTVIVNQDNPGTGDLTISGAAVYSAARRLVRKGL